VREGKNQTKPTHFKLGIKSIRGIVDIERQEKKKKKARNSH